MPDGAPRLPGNTFVLDRPGLARVMSLPPGKDTLASPYLQSYRLPQGILHNPRERPAHHAGNFSHRRRRLAGSRGQDRRAESALSPRCWPRRCRLRRMS